MKNYQITTNSIYKAKWKDSSTIFKRKKTLKRYNNYITKGIMILGKQNEVNTKFFLGLEH
jgi:hypothetical protein